MRPELQSDIGETRSDLESWIDPTDKGGIETRDIDNGDIPLNPYEHPSWVDVTIGDDTRKGINSITS